MASTSSPNLKLELIGTGEQQGTWGSTTNTNLGTLLEEAIGGYDALAMADSNQTLTMTPYVAATARNMTIELTGALTAARTVSLSAALEKVYIVKNSTTNGFAVTFKVTGQPGVSIPNGSTAVLYVDGTDARLVSQSPVPVTLGGTGATTSTGTGSTVLSASPTLTGTPLISANKIDAFPSGTRMLFQQTSAPTGWTKDVSQNDKALRIVSGSVTTGGTTAFSTVFASRTPAGTVGNTIATGSINSTTSTGTVGGTALTEAQLPSHRHFIAANDTVVSTPALSASNYVAYRRSDTNNSPNYTLTGTIDVDATLGLSGATGSGSTHTHSLTMNSHSHTLTMDTHNHTFTGAALDFAVQYVDVIIAAKD
jgi:hypothetical protein